MPLGDFRSIYLPYCIQQNPDGSWVVLNREYKPVGFNTNDYIKYEDYPVSVKLKGLGPSTLEKLSYSGQVSGNRIYLYNDGSNPVLGSAEMKAYLKRVELLSKLAVAK
ncbi:MAG: hypothetical protein HWD57_17045 [Candidatus Accumulibacter cognatus]|uniref:Uncharacterized protein n=1 Tax=Candidatus Accumulibacter cognatus TaxID=2954383 RepID=A0A7D5SC09_9PROT|nr:MAG: hypothetical protein HWD57_17045 [Candidatus Accumulibacter cognatus]